MPKFPGTRSIANHIFAESSDISPSTTAYADGDVIGGIITFSDVVNDIGGGVVKDAVLADTSTVATSLNLFLFNQSPSSVADDNDGFDPADSDLPYIFGRFEFASGSFEQFADNQICEAASNEQPFYTEDGNLYGVLVSRGTPTYAPNQTLNIRLMVARDSN